MTKQNIYSTAIDSKTILCATLHFGEVTSITMQTKYDGCEERITDLDDIIDELTSTIADREEAEIQRAEQNAITLKSVINLGWILSQANLNNSPRPSKQDLAREHRIYSAMKDNLETYKQFVDEAHTTAQQMLGANVMSCMVND